ncbi:MAG: hypothetical protein Q8L52_04055 [bacterium]|nr:hypothetical protein [bacterium]
MFKQSSQSLKVSLSVAGIVALVVLGYIALTNGGSIGTTTSTTSTTQPSATTGQSQTGTAATSYITVAEAQKQLKAIQDQVNAGTLSPEEATKQMNALSRRIAPPPLPSEIKK